MTRALGRYAELARRAEDNLAVSLQDSVQMDVLHEVVEALRGMDERLSSSFPIGTTTAWRVDLVDENPEDAVDQGCQAICATLPAVEAWVSREYPYSTRARCEHPAWNVRTPDGVDTNFVLIACEMEVHRGQLISQPDRFLGEKL